jgi:hypothetical protein
MDSTTVDATSKENELEHLSLFTISLGTQRRFGNRHGGRKRQQKTKKLVATITQDIYLTSTVEVQDMLIFGEKSQRHSR